MNMLRMVDNIKSVVNLIIETAIMSIYCIDSVISKLRTRIVFQNNNERLMGYFIFNDNDGNFLQYIKLAGVPQKDIKQDVLDTCDYLKGNIDIPIFSQRFVNLMGPILENEVSFYPIDIYNNNTHNTFYLTRILRYMDFIDYEKTAHAINKDRENGVFFSSPIVFKTNLTPFLIARDINEPFRWFISDDFKQSCKNNKLKIKFTNLEIK